MNTIIFSLTKIVESAILFTSLIKVKELKMKKIKRIIETPRVTFTAHTEFESREEARKYGWGPHFQHNNVVILTKENRVGAIIAAENCNW